MRAAHTGRGTGLTNNALQCPLRLCVLDVCCLSVALLTKEVRAATSTREKHVDAISDLEELDLILPYRSKEPCSATRCQRLTLVVDFGYCCAFFLWRWARAPLLQAVYACMTHHSGAVCAKGITAAAAT